MQDESMSSPELDRVTLILAGTYAAALTGIVVWALVSAL